MLKSMKFILLASVFLVTFALASDSDQPRLQRTNIIVSDLDRALGLYRDVLGFSLFRVASHKKDSYAYEIFEIDPRAALREAMLSTPTQTRVLGLTEVTGVALAANPKPNRVALVIQTDDIDSIIAKVRTLKLKVFSLDELITVDQRKIREQGFLDWDGNLIVVYSYSQ